MRALNQIDDAMLQTLGTSAKLERGLASAALAGGTALGVLGGMALKMAVDYESSFAGVRKTVDATEAEYGLLAAQLRNLSTIIPTNVNDLNRIAEAAGQLGVKKEDIVGFTKTIAD